MTLDKSIDSGKEKRKQYKGAKSIDKQCRNHGSCPWCEGNRIYKVKKKEPLIEDEGCEDDEYYMEYE